MNLLTRQQAADRLGISVWTLDAERRCGKLAFIQRKANGKVLISEDAIREYLARSSRRSEKSATPSGVSGREIGDRQCSKKRYEKV